MLTKDGLKSSTMGPNFWKSPNLPHENPCINLDNKTKNLQTIYYEAKYEPEYKVPIQTSKSEWSEQSTDNCRACEASVTVEEIAEGNRRAFDRLKIYQHVLGNLTKIWKTDETGRHLCTLSVGDYKLSGIRSEGANQSLFQDRTPHWTAGNIGIESKLAWPKGFGVGGGRLKGKNKM